MFVEVIEQKAGLAVVKALEAKVNALRRDGCDKAEDNEQSLIAIEKDINEIKKKIEVKQ